jgi:hypothetical protein
VTQVNTLLGHGWCAGDVLDPGRECKGRSDRNTARSHPDIAVSDSKLA